MLVLFHTLTEPEVPQCEEPCISSLKQQAPMLVRSSVCSRQCKNPIRHLNFHIFQFGRRFRLRKSQFHCRISASGVVSEELLYFN